MLAAVLSDSLSSCSLLGVPLDAKEEEPSSVPLAKRSKDHTDRTSQLPRFLYPYSSISHKINGISNITLFMSLSVEKNTCAAQWGSLRGLPSLAGRPASGDESITQTGLCLYWKWVLLVLKAVLMPSLSKRERELAPPWTEQPAKEPPALWQLGKEGLAGAHVFLLICPLLRKESLRWKPRYLINYVRSSFALHFLSLFPMITLWLYLILSRVSFFPPFPSPIGSLLLQLQVVFIPVVFLPNLFLRAFLTPICSVSPASPLPLAVTGQPAFPLGLGAQGQLLLSFIFLVSYHHFHPKPQLWTGRR